VGTNWWSGSLIVIIKYLGLGYLVYLASSRVLASATQFITGRFSSGQTPSKGSTMFMKGFLAHAGNPITIAYYLATFSAAIVGKSIYIGMLMGLVAIVSDLTVYLALARINIGKASNVFRWTVVQLAAGLALLYFAAHVSANLSSTGQNAAVSPRAISVMLLAFIFSAIRLAYLMVCSRQGKDNKVLWRIIALWSAGFSVVTLFGAIYSVLSGFDTSTFALTPMAEHRVRICFVVSAVVAATLSLAKSMGEMQDEMVAPSLGADAIDKNAWQGKSWRVGVCVVLFLIAVFVFLSITDFRTKAV
jgi:hypothetical protein